VRANGSRIALWVLAIGLASTAVAQTPAIQYVQPIAIAPNSGSAQFDGNAASDVLLRRGSGLIEIWFLSDGNVSGTSNPATVARSSAVGLRA